MNILKITHSYYPENNAGVEMYVHALASELSKKHHVMLYTRSKPARDPVTVSNGPYKIFKIPKKFAKKRTLKSLKQCIQSFRPGIVHIHHLMGLGLCIPLFLQKQNIPYVISLHDYWFVCPRVRLIKEDGSTCNFPFDNCADCMCREGILKKIFFRYKLGIRKRKVLNVLNNAAYLITPSKTVKKRFLDYGVQNDKFDVSTLGLNLKEFSARENYALNRSDIRIGFIGTVSIFKGVGVLLKAFELLNTDNVLYLYGKMLKGDEKQIRGTIKENSRVVYKGGFDHNDIMRVLGNIDILVVPSICEESHAIVIDEGRAAGVPVIASAIGAVPERIEDGINGFLVEPGNIAALREKLQWLIDNYNNVASRMNFTCKLTSIREDADYHDTVYKMIVTGNRCEDSHN
ncbi:MAG: glycosyltransferase [Nitrospirae bacterium]|nr:glycosyltransferase [Nitrospirota bacterium]